MGRKKGKQSAGFRSKAEKVQNQRSIPRVTQYTSSDQIVKSIEDSQNWTCDGNTENIDRKQIVTFRSLSVRALMEQNRPKALGSKNNSSDVNSASVDTPFKIRLKKIAPDSLAELCVEVVGKYFSCFEFEESLNAIIPPKYIERLSYVSSQNSQLNDDNVKCFFCNDVEKLTLHSASLHSDALMGMLPKAFTIDHSAEDNKYNDKDNHIDDDCDWYDKAEVPCFIHRLGCNQLISLSLSSPVMQASFLKPLSESLPLLKRLEFMHSINTDGHGSSQVVCDAISQFDKLELLNLSYTPWFDDDLFLEMVLSLPLVRTVKAPTTLHPHSYEYEVKHVSTPPQEHHLGDMVEKTRLKHLICRETSVTRVGAKSALGSTALLQGTQSHEPSQHIKSAYSDMKVDV